MASAIAVSINIRSLRFEGATGLLFEDLTFDVAEGQVLALVGPSGVGKSTLLRIIAGLEADYDGVVTVLGRRAAEAPPPGFVFQDPRLLPWLDAVANIQAVSPQTGEEAATKLLAEMGLRGYEHTRPGDLSGGMQRRVALARALAVEPRLLLLDEPFVSIDRRRVRELQDVVARVIEQRTPTMILVSHEPEDAARLADRVIQLEGRPARVVRDDVLDVPRAERSAETIRKITETLTAGTGAP